MFQIGEFVYLVEGTCALPLPSGLLPMDGPHVMHLSSVLEGRVEDWEGRHNKIVFAIH